MDQITELFDTFFNGRPAPRTAELEQLRKENRDLRALIREYHSGRTPPCQCWICQPPKSAQRER